MKRATIYTRGNGQTAIEYMLLLAVVVAIVLVGFKYLVPKSRDASEGFYNKAAIGILGDAPICNKLLDPAQCP